MSRCCCHRSFDALRPVCGVSLPWAFVKFLRRMGVKRRECILGGCASSHGASSARPSTDAIFLQLSFFFDASMMRMWQTDSRVRGTTPAQPTANGRRPSRRSWDLNLSLSLSLSLSLGSSLGLSSRAIPVARALIMHHIHQHGPGARTRRKTGRRGDRKEAASTEADDIGGSPTVPDPTREDSSYVRVRAWRHIWLSRGLRGVTVSRIRSSPRNQESGMKDHGSGFREQDRCRWRRRFFVRGL
ncbi:hypothetical protein C8Q78DRAFT_602564 [Trametes maxima]|nr:hypothetical protein C8Q78DRAFT_602564 [Trametes maxima]